MDEVKKFTSRQFFNTLLTLPDTLKLIFQLEKRYALYLIILNVITAIVPLASLFIYQDLINSVLGTSQHLITIIIIYFAIQVATTVLGQVEDYISSKFEMNLSYNINMRLMKTTSSLELSDYEQSNMYNIIEKVTQDSTYKPFQLFNAIIRTFSSFISLLMSLFFIGTWNIGVSLLLLIIPILSLVIFLRVGQLEFLIQWKRANDERETWYMVYLLTHDFSFKEIKLNNISNYFIDKFANLKKKFIEQDLSISRRKAFFNVILDLLLNCINIAVVLAMILAVRAGQLLIGNLVSLIQAISKINTYSQTMIQNIYIIYNTSLFMEQLFEFLERERNSKSVVKSELNSNDIETIKITNLSYVYPNSDNFALDNINLSFKKGELTAIVGKNGSGKSTLVKLIAGLYKPTTGNIQYNNIVDDLNSDEFYQKNVSVLFQDFVKYELTVRENIGLSDSFSTWEDKKIYQILDNLGLDFLKTNDKYELEMQLGNWFQEGRQLSGGQWQKIALARTFFKKASIYILDEPNAALDPVAEKEIFDYFIKLSKKYISIFISHNLSSAKKANKIVVMKDGQIEDIGDHDSLLKGCQYYRELYYSEKYEDAYEASNF
ncbi:ABC transporter ATP-binding protein [Streptococcus intermedius]|uniref:ABC transporter ATP-binding protein n=1 Tax=Streptococcus intermedius TaxID=1338 RepID=UPI000660578D|nr:ABC transporter ATP-binding protein [Streptococcus intermedius]PMR63761.1 ABC transporter ATP-binding protein [Streptococcus intermedius]WOI90887.1 ABC transporter ATP-binding protein [Streptococcus intermedius]